jgi:hypothetical protein
MSGLVALGDSVVPYCSPRQAVAGARQCIPWVFMQNSAVKTYRAARRVLLHAMLMSIQ